MEVISKRSFVNSVLEEAHSSRFRSAAIGRTGQAPKKQLRSQLQDV
jgi:hypothetical protein